MGRELVAIDVAVLPPDNVREQAIALSTALWERGSKGVRLDDSHLPHITLTQQFVRAAELDVAMHRIDDVVRSRAPLALRVTGAAQSGQSVWMAIERTPALADLHERLMDALRNLEHSPGTPASFYEGDARPQDVLWVTGYRSKASFGAFTPHITLGHAARPPEVKPSSFQANTIVACHLGRFCSCRRILRHWTLSGSTI